MIKLDHNNVNLNTLQGTKEEDKYLKVHCK